MSAVFDRFMVSNNIGTNRKLRRLPVQQRWCYVAGVLALASQSPIRGALLITDGEPVTAEDLAEEATVPLSVARAALESFRRLGMLDRDEHGVEWVHDWDSLNPSPKPSDAPEATRARKREQRARDKAARGGVTVTRESRPGHAMSRREEEEEVKKEQRSPSDSVELGIFDYWREQTGHTAAKATRDRLSKVKARLNEGYTTEQIRAAIDGAATQPFRNDDGKVFDDLELICRSGSKLESFIDRATYTPQRPAHQLSGSSAAREQRQAERERVALRLAEEAA